MKALVALVIVCLIISLSILALPAKAQEPLNLTINPDGSIDPVGAPIQRDGDIYNLTADAHGINVNRNNITLDGNRHTLSHTLSVSGVANVTIKNFIVIIQGFDDNIHLENCSNVTIANNTLTSSKLNNQQGGLGIDVWGGKSNIITGNRIMDNVRGITFESTTSNNRVFGNNITNNFRGLWIQQSQNNSIYNNNFDNNTVNVFIIGEAVIRGSEKVVTPLLNTFDNGTVGNYWSNYNGTDSNGDGIGDVPYVIDEYNRDNHPLMKPVFVPDFPFGPDEPEPFPITIVVGSAIAAVVVVGLGLLVYFKKRKH